MTQGTVMAETKRRIAEENVTKITGEPTAEDVEQLQIELAEIAVKFDTGIFQGGDELGHMCLIVSEQKYREEIEDQNWTYNAPERPEAFDPNLGGTAGEVSQKRRIAEHNRKIHEYELFKGVTQGLHEKIQWAVEEQYVRALKQPMVGYACVTPRQMLEHLKSQCTVGTLDIDKLEKALNDPWETEDHISEYLSKMKLKREKLQAAGITISDEQMVIKIVKQMFLCGHFDELELTAWERRAKEQKTLEDAKTYFGEKYREKMSFRKATARQLGYVNQAREIPRFDEMLEKVAEASMEDRQYVNAMAENNNKASERIMETMLEQSKQMMALMEKMATNQNGRNKAVKVNNVTNDDKCPLCKRKKHQGGITECWADPKNADKRPQWYKEKLECKAKKEAEKKSE